MLLYLTQGTEGRPCQNDLNVTHVYFVKANALDARQFNLRVNLLLRVISKILKPESPHEIAILREMDAVLVWALYCPGVLPGR